MLGFKVRVRVRVRVSMCLRLLVFLAPSRILFSLSLPRRRFILLRIILIRPRRVWSYLLYVRVVVVPFRFRFRLRCRCFRLRTNTCTCVFPPMRTVGREINGE